MYLCRWSTLGAASSSSLSCLTSSSSLVVGGWRWGWAQHTGPTAAVHAQDIHCFECTHSHHFCQCLDYSIPQTPVVPRKHTQAIDLRIPDTHTTCGAQFLYTPQSTFAALNHINLLHHTLCEPTLTGPSSPAWEQRPGPTQGL